MLINLIDHAFKLGIGRCSKGHRGTWESNEKEVQVGNDQEKAQTEKNSHTKNRGGKKQTNNKVFIP